jgi:hypothetical protein
MASEVLPPEALDALAEATGSRDSFMVLAAVDEESWLLMVGGNPSAGVEVAGRRLKYGDVVSHRPEATGWLTTVVEG